MAERTSLRVGGTPEFLFEPASEGEAADLLRRCRREGIPVRFLGGGCNLLVGDGTIQGAVVATRRLRGTRVLGDRVEAAAGNPFPELARRAIQLQVPVLPGLPGIPGSVGGVVFMNAGGRHGTVGDALLEVTGLDLEGTPYRRPVREGDLRYRQTAFEGTLVTGAVFRRDPSLDPAMLRRLHDEALAHKRATQPLSSWSAGCMFKNPDGPSGPRSAGRLIEEAGLKGRRLGGARVSPLHANFVLNESGATSAEVHALVGLVQAEVRRHCGVALELEVRTWS